MPIQVDSKIRVFTQNQFHELDHRVMPVVHAVHDEFGRLLDEAVFKRTIALRCAAKGIEAEQEVRIRVTHDTFAKDYFLDVLLAHGMMVEAKATETLTRAHRAQALNYLLLTGMQHGRLVNLRPAAIQDEFVSTRLGPVARREFSVVDSGWIEPNEPSAWLKGQFIELLRDWGAFLEVGLYREAIVHFLGGPEAACPEIEVLDGPRPVGHQRVCLLTDDTAFSCTALTRDRDTMREHQLRFLAHSRLRFIQWVNLNRARIEFTTLSREGLAR